MPSHLEKYLQTKQAKAPPIPPIGEYMQEYGNGQTTTHPSYHLRKMPTKVRAGTGKFPPMSHLRKPLQKKYPVHWQNPPIYSQLLETPKPVTYNMHTRRVPQ
jgi:hypothetical protein